MRQESTFSPATLNLAEQINRGLGRLGAPFVSLVAGSDYENYVQLPWRKTDVKPSSIGPWVAFGGDPWVGELPQVWRRLPRNWRYAGVVASYSWALRNAKPKDQAAREAVAYVADDIVRVAPLPEGTSFTDLPDTNGRSLQGMALRVGSGLLKATIGWLSEEGGLSVPYKVFAPTAPVAHPIEEISQKFPGILLG